MVVESEKKKLQFKSPAEFFANNKNIAGFDNPGKSLYTTIREFVENSLDAAESIQELPELSICIDEISEEDLFTLRGGKLNLERVNETLYRDYYDEKSSNSKGKGSKKIKLASGSQDAEATEDSPLPNKRSQVMFYRVTVRDNGSGMPFEDVPNMFGRVLAGTKYGVKQARGKFGLGAKMALIWSKCSSGCPIEIKTSQSTKGPLTYCKLDIDIYKNQPNVLTHKRLDNTDQMRGSEISVIIEGNWTTYRAKILNYLRQMAIITPYAHIEFSFNAINQSKSFGVLYGRRSTTMPRNATEVKYHPSSVNLLLIKKLAEESMSRRESLLQFLTRRFSNIDNKLAKQIVSELGPKFESDMYVSSLSENMFLTIAQLFKQMRFPDPDGDCLSPAGEYNIRLGIIKELNPDMIATYTEKCRVFEGHPFVVEAAVSLGGKTVNPGLNIYRFANRIPLLFEAGADVVTRTANTKINWANYKIKQQVDKIGVFVSIVATKIPFKGTGKEYIGDDIEEIALAVKHAIQQCCLQLKSKISKEAELRSRQERKQNLTKYIPNVAKSIIAVLESIGDAGLVENANVLSLLSEDGDFRGLGNVSQLVEKVSRKQITVKDISAKLVRHVEEEDASQALEVVRETTLKKNACYLIDIPVFDGFDPDRIKFNGGSSKLESHSVAALSMSDEPTVNTRLYFDKRFQTIDGL